MVTQAFMMNDARKMLRNKKYDDDIQTGKIKNVPQF